MEEGGGPLDGGGGIVRTVDGGRGLWVEAAKGSGG